MAVCVPLLLVVHFVNWWLRLQVDPSMKRLEKCLHLTTWGLVYHREWRQLCILLDTLWMVWMLQKYFSNLMLRMLLTQSGSGGTRFWITSLQLFLSFTLLCMPAIPLHPSYCLGTISSFRQRGPAG